MDCSVSGCARPAEKAGLCAMHRKRQQRGVGLDAPEQERLSPYERLLVATLAVCDADPDDDQDFALRKRRQGYAVDCVVVERFNQLVDEWLAEGGIVPASHVLARGVQRLLRSEPARTVPRSGEANAPGSNRRVEDGSAKSARSAAPAARARVAPGAQVVRGDRRGPRHLEAVRVQAGDDGARRDPDEDGGRRRKGARS
jgi:hypothetical protein